MRALKLCSTFFPFPLSVLHALHGNKITTFVIASHSLFKNLSVSPFGKLLRVDLSLFLLLLALDVEAGEHWVPGHELPVAGAQGT